MLDFLRRTPLSPPEPKCLRVTISGKDIEVTVKRVATARRFTLRVRAATSEVVLTLPTRGSLVRAREFIHRNAPWLAARLSQLPVRVSFEPGAVVPIRGVHHSIVHRPGARRVAWIEAEANERPVLLLCVSGEAEHVPRRVADYLRREAKRDLEAAVTFHCQGINRAVSKITLRDTTSRWGSCSSRGALSFSWRLILAPSFVLDYLAAHEVAHLAHLNHSPAFWRLARSMAPRLAEAEDWLKRHGAELHRFGAK